MTLSELSGLWLADVAMLCDWPALLTVDYFLRPLDIGESVLSY